MTELASGAEWSCDPRVEVTRLDSFRPAPVVLRHCYCLGLGVVLLAVCSGQLASAAQAPQLDDVSPRGLQIGGVTQVTIQGRDLDHSLQVIVPLAAPVQATVVSVTGDRAQLNLVVDPTVPPGLYPLRVATNHGISNAFMVGVDKLPQLSFRETIVDLPVALHGTLTGDQVQRCELAGRKGQRLVIDIEAQRLGARLRPVVRLISPSNQQLGIAQPSRRLGGDSRLVVELPEDGLYRIELHDIVYRGEAPGWYRLKLGELQFADHVYPLAVGDVAQQRVELIAGDTLGAVNLRPRQEWGAAGQAAPWPTDSERWYTGAAPWVRFGQLGTQEYTEDQIKTESIELHCPMAVNGKLNSKGEQDEFRVHVRAGAKLRIELFADRWDIPLDGVLDVLDTSGKSLAHADDQPGTTDPGVEIDVAGDVNEIVVRVSSLTATAGSPALYRLVVQPRAPRPVRLTTDLDRLQIPAGGRVVVPLQIDRGETEGAIELSVSPAIAAAISLAPSQLDAGDELGLVAFQASALARGCLAARVLAQSINSPTNPPVCLVTAAFPGTQYRPAWRSELMIAVTPAGPLDVDWGALGQPPYLARGTTRALPVQLQRASAATGPVRLSIVTSQRSVTKQVDNKDVEDIERMLRLESNVIVPADEVNATLQLTTPYEMALHEWSIAVRADLLSADPQQVLATAYTPVRRWPTIEPLRMSVEIPEKVTIQAGDETGWVVRGKLERHADFVFPATIRLLGLVDKDSQPTVTVAADQGDFEFRVRFAADAQPRELKNLQLVAVTVDPLQADPKLATAEVRSAPFTIDIKK